MFSLPTRNFFARNNKSTARQKFIRATVALVTSALIAAPLIAATPAIAAPLTVDLGAATGYSVLGSATVTNTGNTIVGGELGVSPGTAVTGFPTGTILANGGKYHSADASAAAAQSAVTAAYNDAMGRTPSGDVVGDDYQLGGQTFTPGVYASSSSAQITGTVTLDGQGNPNAVFIFKMGSTLTTAAGSPSIPASIVKLTNGARAANVFWAVGSSATLGTYSYFAGTVLALASVTVTTGAHINGRTFASTAAVTLDNDDFATPPSFSPTVAITSPDSTTSATPTISGTVTAPRGSTVTVTVSPSSGPARSVQATVTDGTWSAVSPTLVGGQYRVVATVTELDGSTGTATQTLTVNRTGPAVTITPPGYTRNSTPTISGTVTAPSGSTVTVTVKSLFGPVIETLAAAVAGTTWTALSPKLADGAYSVDATVTAPDSETGSAVQQSLTIYTKTPLVTIAPLGLTNNPSPTISGAVTAPNGSTVSVTVTPSTGVAKTFAATVTGTSWSAQSPTLADGTYAVDATVTDPAGNTGTATTRTLTVYTTTPLITITPLGLTNNPTPTITGTVTAPVGSTVTVTIAPSGGAAIILPATLSSNSWSVTTSALADGTYSVDATVVDPAGNTGKDVQQSLTIDTATPAIVITSANPTKSSAPTISGTVMAPAGSTVTVTIASPFATLEKRTAVVTDSSWTAPSAVKLANGMYTVIATVTTPANNSNHDTQALKVDAAIPVVAINALGLTKNATPTISGTVTAPVGSTVSVTIMPSTGVAIILPATVSRGTWSVTPSQLADDTYTVDATVTDPAGNTGKAASRSLTIDTTAPVVTIAALGLTNNPTPTISGTANVPDDSIVTVTITRAGSAPITVSATVTDGTWSITAPMLNDGTYSVGASAKDAAGNTGRAAPQWLTVDTVKPTIRITSGNPTNNPTPTISGTVIAPMGSTVSVVVTPPTGLSFTLPATVTGSSTWSVVSPKLADGTYEVVATVITPAKNTGNATQGLVVDSTAPIVRINVLGVTNNSTPTISGTTNMIDGRTVSVTITPVGGGTPVATAATVSHSTWSVVSPKLADGVYTVGASGTDKAGNTGTATPQSLTIETAKPAIAITSANPTTSARPTISGTVTAPAGSTVIVTIASPFATLETLTAVVSGGTWMAPSSVKLSDDVYTVVATVTTPASNTNHDTQSLTVDATVPLVTINPLGLTNNATPTISGTLIAPVDSTVIVTITPSKGPAIIRPATVSGATWSVTVPKLADGAYTVDAKVTDPAGNTGNAAPELLSVDTVKPTIRITSGNPTNNPSPTISGTLIAPTGSTVSVVVTPPTGLPFTLPATVTGSSTWSVVSPRLADGTYEVVATVITPAKNTNNATQGLVVDSTAPIVRINVLGLTNNSTPTISGTTNMIDGRTVSVTITPVGGGTPVATTATVSHSTWSVVSPKLADGVYSVGASGTDKAGNTGTATPQSLTIDSTAPIVTIATLGLTNNSAPRITGTANVPNLALVTVTITPLGGTPMTLSAIVTDGKWSITAPKLTDGTYSVGASAIDPAGNIGRALPQPLAIDTIAPIVTINPSGLTNSATPTITGTADVPDGSVVTVTITPSTGTPYVLPVVVKGGSWSLIAPKLLDGTFVIGATATDLAGNVGKAAQQSLTVDTIAPVVAIRPLGLTNNPTPKISGTAGVPDGAIVTITITPAIGAPVTLTATVSGGTWSMTSPKLADGAYTITATAVDLAGNIGSALPQALTIRTVKPAITITSPGGASIATPTIFGTTNAAAGSIVTVTVDGVVLTPSPLVGGGSAPAVASVASLSVRSLRAVSVGGTWTIVSTKLKDGIHAVTASVTDPAGNVGTDAQTLTITSGLPTLPFDPPSIEITSPATSTVAKPTISGTTFDVVGSVITVSVDGVDLPTTVPTGAGTWSVVSRSLSTGSHAVIATIVNAHGSAQASQTLVINTQPATSAISPATIGLALTGGNSSGGIWGLLLIILGALALLGRSIQIRSKASSNR